MGNSTSQKRIKVLKQACKEGLPDMDKGQCKQQFFSHRKQRNPSTKIVLLSPLDKRQQLAGRAVGPCPRSGRPGEDASSAPAGSPSVAPNLRGAGDGAERREGAREREMKMILVPLLLLDAWLQEEGRRAAGGAGGGAGGGPEGGAKVVQDWQLLYAHLLTQSEPDRERDPGEEQPRKRRRCPRPRP